MCIYHKHCRNAPVLYETLIIRLLSCKTFTMLLFQFSRELVESHILNLNLCLDGDVFPKQMAELEEYLQRSQHVSS